jgi:thiol-disulfide isomerase/thioredoxin
MLRPALTIFVATLLVGQLEGQQPKIVWSPQEAPLFARIRGLRDLPDAKRAKETKDLALSIRALPVVPNKLTLASDLTNLSTEGDFGRDTLQEVTTTLAQCLREQPARPPEAKPGQPVQLVAAPYMSLAQLVKYEHMKAALDSPQFDLALAKLAADDAQRQEADFTLTDLAGHKWTRTALLGKVVVVNFWATWCPPCRKEMPDLDALYKKFRGQGLVVLAISDEDEPKVREFLKTRPVSYPVMLDKGRQVNELYRVEGIPKTYIYGRDGQLVTESIDMRTRAQFLAMLAQAGIR